MSSLTKRQIAIVDAAILLTAEKGIQALTTKNLAAALGVTEPALYRHFASKNDMIEGMLLRFEEAADSLMASPTLTGADALMQFIKARFALVQRKPQLSRVIFSEELFMGDPEHARSLLSAMRHHRERVSTWIAQAQATGDIRSDVSVDILFRLIFGPVRLLIKQWGMSGQAFDLCQEGEKLLSALRTILYPPS